MCQLHARLGFNRIDQVRPPLIEDAGQRCKHTEMPDRECYLVLNRREEKVACRKLGGVPDQRKYCVIGIQVTDVRDFGQPGSGLGSDHIRPPWRANVIDALERASKIGIRFGRRTHERVLRPVLTLD